MLNHRQTILQIAPLSFDVHVGKSHATGTYQIMILLTMDPI